MQELKDAGENPYPHKFHVSTSLEDFIEKYNHLNDGDVVENTTVRIAGELKLAIFHISIRRKSLQYSSSHQFYFAGRVHSIRESSSKLRFYDVRGEGVKLQVMANAKYYKNQDEFEPQMDRVRRGDIVGIVGLPAKTKKVSLAQIK